MEGSTSVFCDLTDDTTSNAIQAGVALGRRSHPRLSRHIEPKPVCFEMPDMPSITTAVERYYLIDDIAQRVAECLALSSHWKALDDAAQISTGPLSAVGKRVRIVVREPEKDAVKQSILSRLKELHAAAADEEMTINPDSERDFRVYVLEHMRPGRRPAVSLLENGNLRAVWKGSSGQQVGMQFRGDGWIQYVLFALTLPEQMLATSVGRKTFSGVVESIRQMKLDTLIYK